MNITDYIVECLKKGKIVEIPGVGTWKSVVENAHFDEQSATFYPTRTVVNFDSSTTGNEEFVGYLAEEECISPDVAKQMVNNYAEALGEKIEKEEIVTVGALGVLRSQGGIRSFVSHPMTTSADETMPLSNIKTYNISVESDPFAVFDPVKRAEAALREQQAAEAKAEAERLSGVANIVGGSDILQGNETVELTPQEVREREKLVKEEMKRIKQEEKDKEREAREAAIREQDDTRRAEGDVLPEDHIQQERAEKEIQKEKARKEKEELEVKRAEEKREKEEQKARERAEKEELEAKSKAEKEALKEKERLEKEAIEAKKAEEKREKDELKAREKAEKEELEAKAKAEKEAMKEKERREKEEREAKAKAEKEAMKEKERREKEEREAKAKAEKEAMKEKERREKEEREAKAKAEKEVQKEKERLEKEEREAKYRAEKEIMKAKAEQEKAELEAKEKADKEAKKMRKQQEKAEKEAMKLRKKEERKAAKEARKKSQKQKAVSDPMAVPSLTGLADLDNGTEKHGKKRKEKKRKKTWLWILLALLLLLLVGAASVYFGKPDFAKPAHDWFFTNVMNQEQKETVELDIDNMVSNSGEQTGTSNHESRSVTTQPASPKGLAAEVYCDACLFSFNENLTEFSAEDIENSADAINDYVSGYITQYLNEKHYSTAKVPMMERIRQYTVSRLIELYDNSGYSEERFFASGDYVSDYLTEFKKAHKGRQKQVMVQSEIMDRSFLDNMLNTMVEEIGLKADNAKVAMPPAPPAPPVIKTEKKSRQGFDLIAGFYTNATTAQKMVDRLKGYGCAAYIIEINHGYYVSMGSTSTRTQAEEKYRKAKEWYDGDLSIKSF